MSQVDPKPKLVTLCVKLAKIGVKVVRHGQYVTFQLAQDRISTAVVGGNPGTVLPTIARAPPLVQTHTRAAVSRDELDTGVFQRVLDLGDGLNGPSDRAVAAFHALYGGQVDIGLLGKLARGPAQERPRRANLIRGQHALISIKLLQNCGKR